MTMKFATIVTFIAASIIGRNAEASNATRLLMTTVPPTTPPSRITYCDGNGMRYSCDQFSSRALADYWSGFVGGTISYYSHYLNGKYNWFAVLNVKGTRGGDCWMGDMACNCGAQLDRWFQIPAGYTGAQIPGGSSSDYVVAWRNDGQHSQDWHDYSQIRLSC